MTVFAPERGQRDHFLIGWHWWTNGGRDARYSDGRTLWYTYLTIYLLAWEWKLLLEWCEATFQIVRARPL